MATLLIESCRMLRDDELTTANILIEDGSIRRISKLPPSSRPDTKIDASRLIAIPGLIDVHVHLRDMELAYKETFETGTQAAAVGGFTTVLDMPNTKPPTTNRDRLAEKISKAKGRIYSNVGFQAALVEDSAELRAMAKEGAIAFKLYLNKALETFDAADDNALRKALHAARDAGAMVTVHAEDGVAIHAIQEKIKAEGVGSVRDFLKAHKPEFEVSAVRRILEFSKNHGLRVHICHISTPDGVRLVRKSGIATCEATAHHLLINDRIFLKQGTKAICVPPIRCEAYRRKLWSMFAKGAVEILASDHAPHTMEEKTKVDAWEAAPGVPGLETSLPVLHTQVARSALSLRRLVDAAATLPARIFGLPRKGKLAVGYDADIVLLDPKAKTKIEPSNFLTMARYSPFAGMRCVGRAAYTIVNGSVVAQEGRIVGPAAGNIVKRAD